VSERADGPLGQAARNVLAKAGAVLPDDLKVGLDTSGLLIGPGAPIAAGDGELAAIRQAIRSERKLQIAYADESGAATARTVWPVALAFFDRTRVVVAWCELRDGYRHFRTDRITALAMSADRLPRRRTALLKDWRTLQGVPEQ
jgi:predicted DNA-binding transcriptional regulator YafY